MEMKKLHMGTMSYGWDSMDEVGHQLLTAFGDAKMPGKYWSFLRNVGCSDQWFFSDSRFPTAKFDGDRHGSGDTRSKGHVH